jgi:uncharacterized protein HemX
MSNVLQNGANLSTILTAVLALLIAVGGWVWRISQGQSRHDSRLEQVEASCKRAESDHAENLRTARDSAERLARIETDVRWLRETLGGERKR